MHFCQWRTRTCNGTLVNICTSKRDSLFLGCYDGMVTRKMMPMQSILHWPKEMKVRSCHIYPMWWVQWKSPAKTGYVLHDLQTGMGSGFILLQKEGCFLLWPASGISRFQLSQHHNVAVRIDGLSRLQERQKDQPFSIPKHSAHLFNHECCVLNFFIQQGIDVSLLHGL